jgi:hypothetical protein
VDGSTGRRWGGRAVDTDLSVVRLSARPSVRLFHGRTEIPKDRTKARSE